LARIYGRIAKIPAQLSYGLVHSAMGQIPCSTERISSSFITLTNVGNLEFFYFRYHQGICNKIVLFPTTSSLCSYNTL